MTVASLLGLLYPRLHAVSDADLVWWTKADLIGWINEGITQLCHRADILVYRNTADSTASGDKLYDLPAGALKVVDVAVAGQPLRPASMAELDALDHTGEATFRDEGARPTHWFNEGLGLAQIGLYPVPIAAEQISKVYAGEPGAELAEGSTIPLPDLLAGYLMDYALERAYAKRGEAGMPEVAEHLRGKLEIYYAAAAAYWGD